MDKTKAADPTDVRESPLQSSLRAWNRFWFTPADPTLLGLIRICCGAITLYTIVAYSFTLQDVLGEHAWANLALVDDYRHNRPIFIPPAEWKYVPPTFPEPANEKEQQEIKEFRMRWTKDPREVYAKGSTMWSIWFHVTDPTWMAIVHACICIVIFLFTIGLGTRITSVLTWAAALSYINRSPPTLFGVDTMMNILLLYLMIGPSGAALSVDRLLARWWARHRGAVLARWRAFWHRGEETGPLPAPALLGPPEPSVGANFAIRLLQIHVCIVYVAAGLAKLLGPAWWNCIAVWKTLANFEFAPMQYESYMMPLRWLCNHRVLWELVMTSANYFTLFFEISYCFLIWRPSTRWLILTMAIILHGVIGVFMGLKTFSLMMLVMNMAFLSPQMVTRFLGIFSRGKPAGEAPSPTPSAQLEPALAGVPSARYSTEPESNPARERIKRKKLG
jgi:hypothetical protein